MLKTAKIKTFNKNKNIEVDNITLKLAKKIIKKAEKEINFNDNNFYTEKEAIKLSISQLENSINNKLNEIYKNNSIKADSDIKIKVDIKNIFTFIIKEIEFTSFNFNFKKQY